MEPPTLHDMERPQITWAGTYADQPDVECSTERPVASFRTRINGRQNPVPKKNTCWTLTGRLSAKPDHRWASQEVIVMKRHPHLKPSHLVSIWDTIAALYAKMGFKKESHKPLQQKELKTSTQINQTHWVAEYNSKYRQSKSHFWKMLGTRYKTAQHGTGQSCIFQ